MTEIQNDFCEDSKCEFNRDGTRHKIHEHEKLQSANLADRVSEPKAEDYAYAISKGGLAAIPYAGGIISEVFATVVPSPYQKRVRSFVQTSEERLSSLEKSKGLDIKSLKNDDEFLDIVIQATEIAAKNSQKEKLRILQNCVLNTALKINIARDKKLMYLNIVNQITPTHLAVLNLVANPETAVRGLLTRIIELGDRHEQKITILKDFADVLGLDQFLFSAVINDLNNWGILTKVDEIHSTGITLERIDEVVPSVISATKQKITAHGTEFLIFIEDPAIV